MPLRSFGLNTVGVRCALLCWVTKSSAQDVGNPRFEIEDAEIVEDAFVCTHAQFFARQEFAPGRNSFL